MRFLVLLLVFSFISCSVYKTRRTFNQSEVVISNGVYGDSEWDTELVFSRNSWYKEASLTNEILLSEINSDSNFSKWLGSDNSYFSSCQKFYIALVYSDHSAKQGTPYLLAQLARQGFVEKSILNFSDELKAHQNFKDWNLFEHKILGICQTGADNTQAVVTLPGFKAQALKISSK